MKDEYIDQYGIDSLPQLKEASQMKAQVFVTSNKSVLDDRKELEEAFSIKIRTPEELMKDDSENRT